MQRQSGLGLAQERLPAAVRLEGAYLAQVIAVLPAEHAVSVLLPALASCGHELTGARPDGSRRLIGLRARVLEHRAGPYHGDLDLPREGDWGLVVFPQGSDQMAVWLGSLYQDLNLIATANRRERLAHHDSGVWWRVAEDGTAEWSHPSGTYVRLGEGTTLSSRTRQEQQGATKRTVTYTPPTKPAVTLHLRHSSGTTITVDPAGNIEIVGVGAKQETIEGNVTEDYQGTKQETVAGGVTESYEASWILSVGTNGSITVAGNLTITADDLTIASSHPSPGLHLHLGGTTGEDWIALKAALDKIKAAFDAHVHGGVQAGPNNSGAPTAPIPAFVQDTDYSGQAKVT